MEVGPEGCCTHNKSVLRNSELRELAVIKGLANKPPQLLLLQRYLCYPRQKRGLLSALDTLSLSSNALQFEHSWKGGPEGRVVFLRRHAETGETSAVSTLCAPRRLFLWLNSLIRVTGLVMVSVAFTLECQVAFSFHVCVDLSSWLKALIQVQ